MRLYLFLISTALAEVHAPQDPPLGRPQAIVDLDTREGAALVQAGWRYHDAQVVNGEIVPKSSDDDAGWPVIDSLTARRGAGKVSFGWYRTRVTLPQRVGHFDVQGATVALEVVLDDYAEIWVDGRLPVVLGQSGGAVVKGFNAPNRVILTREARPGQSFAISIFGINGPISAVPANHIWIRSATLDFHRPRPDTASHGDVLRKDRALDAIVPPGARIEKLADGFQFTEGPVWHPDGYLLFSDPNANTIYRWDPNESLSVYRAKSGYSGVDVGDYHQPGSNGLAIDRQGRLTVDEHGRRRVVRIEKNGEVTVLADRWQGKRLNSPNDLVYRSDGALYFTDPPFGLPAVYDDAQKELPFSGVFCWKDGDLKLAATDLKGPNGIAFAPGERHLYVSNWDEKAKVILRYEVRPDCSLGNPVTFFDLTRAPGEEALDGLKVDRAGNVYASGPGGVWIVSPEGKHLGTLRVAELPANFAWGDSDGRALYMTARTGLYRIRLAVPGIR